MFRLRFESDHFPALAGHSSADLGTFGSGSGTAVGSKRRLVFSWLPRERISLFVVLVFFCFFFPPLIFTIPVDF